METLKKPIPVRVEIAAILRKALFTGEYKSGDELSLTGVAAQLGVSRTPVREAFQTLESEGLIELRMNKGAIVKPIDDRYITGHFETRELLESEAAYRAAQRGMEDAPALLKRLKTLQKDMDKSADKSKGGNMDVDKVQTEEYESLNHDIHTAIWAAAQNDCMAGILQNLWNGPSVSITSPKADHYRQSTEEHIAIITAIEKKDAETAREVMAKHIRRSMNNILQNLG